MDGSFKLGRIQGIEIGIHYSWLFVFGLLTFSLARGLLPNLYAGWTTTQYWLIGGLAALLLFLSVLAHELGHSLVAQAKGIPVRSIILFIFGGVASLTQEPRKARDEFQIAIAGPAVSLAIGVVSIVLFLLLERTTEYLAAILLYLGYANLLLVAFNLIPGFPLDGGRVFRAIVWGITNSLQRATKIASTVGVVIGYIFIAIGIFLVFSNPISGIWLIAIGWFLQNAADQSYRQLALERMFEGVTVGGLMNEMPVTVGPELTLEELVDHYVLAYNVRGVPVVQGGQLLGIITLTDIRHTPRREWSQWTVRAKMTPWDRLITVTPETSLQEALQAMAMRDIHQIPVVRDGALVGLLTRSQVIRFLQLRAELPAEAPAPTPEAPEPTGRHEHAD